MGGSHRHLFDNDDGDDDDDEENEEEDDDVYMYSTDMSPDDRADYRATSRASKVS